MAEDPERSIHPGSTFAGLEVREVIGQGAFSRVVRAYDPLAQRTVALKVLDPIRTGRDEAARERVLREARLVARIDHPHVVRLLKVHPTARGSWVFEMEDCAGGSLARRLKERGALDAGECRRTFRALVQGVEAAHRLGIVHHDIKPGNVLLTDAGQIKLADFGLGRLVADGSMSQDAVEGRRGTPFYMAPEAVMGGPAGPAADFWSLGVLLYEMLAGRRPFNGRTLESLFHEILNTAPPPLPPHVPGDLRETVLACLAKASDGRPETAADLLRILEASPTATQLRIEAAGPQVPTTLIGRSRQSSWLRHRFEDACRGEGRAALIAGEPGIGKSALLDHLGREVRAQRVRWIGVQASAFEGWVHAVGAALRESLRGDPSSSAPGVATQAPGPGSEALDRLLRDSEADASSPPALRSASEVEQALVALAARQPLVVAVEDTHLCDRDDLRMLGGLARGLAGSPVLLAMTYRTSGLEGSDSSRGQASGYFDLIGVPEVERLELPRLEEHEVRELLERVAGVVALPSDVVDRIARESDGVPLFAIELFRHLRAAGELAVGEGRVRVTSRWRRSELPRRLLDMVAQRMAGLTEDDRMLLETAAANGLTFDGASLAAVLGQPLLPVLRALQRLYRDATLVVPLERGFRFGHALFQEVLYGEMAPELRRELHRAWAEALEAGASSKSPDSEVLGWHWEEAGEAERARPYLLRAADAASTRSEFRRAWDLAERAGLLAGEATPEVLRDNRNLLLRLIGAYTSEEETLRIRELHDRLARAAAALEDETMRRSVVVRAAWFDAFRAGAPPLDLEAVEDAATHLEDSDDRGDALWLLGTAAARAHDFAGARRRYEEAMRVYEACGRPERSNELLQPLAGLCRVEASVDEAAALYDRAATWYEGMANTKVQAALARTMAVFAAAQAGRPEGAGDDLKAPIRALERLGQEPRAAAARVKQAQLYEAEGRVQEARRALERTEPVLATAAFANAPWSLFVRKAHLEMAAGSLEAAEASLQRAEAADPTVDPIDAQSAAQVRALGLVAEGDDAAAVARVIAGLDLIGPTPERLDLSHLLVETIHLAVLGADLSPAASRIHDLAAGPDALPHMLRLALEIAEVLCRPPDAPVEAAALERAALRLRDPRLGWYQATCGVAASLLSAQVQLLRGEAEVAGSLLFEAAQRARRIEHVWLEWRALELARAADLALEPSRGDALAALVAERNPTDATRVGRVVRRWNGPSA